ncbi:nucleotidyltransferase family protein [Azotosporobacter soli]|uniref:nucleotidyltransferase family protein n=1 Tax=Azotosporobacter soli TaxID=3055040 RepID=UPI0031FF3868
MYDAIILAGGENKGPLRGCSDQPYEALIEIAGKPMVSFVAVALAAVPEIETIWVVGPAAQLAACPLPPKAKLLEGGASIIETIRLGLAKLEPGRKAIVATGDIPLLTPEAVQEFLRLCRQQAAEVYYPIISRELNDAHYPGSKRTYVRFTDGVYTGGNLFLVDPVVVPRCVAVAEKIIANRKNPLQLCRILGWGFVVRFILGRLSLEKVKDRVAQLLGVSGAVIYSQHPQVGIDVDKPSDLELVRDVFARTVDAARQ